ncbi:hypothetical protein Taro_039740 [Colocasia esculenta]|uniref:Uncharacterized protein n=1 Tax=Colocasia esculenta TaxID=4460 RepID=A0A843WGM3_COLES|nr:hypothetical protein [Colocasia esculenta]
MSYRAQSSQSLPGPGLHVVVTSSISSTDRWTKSIILPLRPAREIKPRPSTAGESDGEYHIHEDGNEDDVQE